MPTTLYIISLEQLLQREDSRPSCRGVSRSPRAGQVSGDGIAFEEWVNETGRVLMLYAM